MHAKRDRVVLLDELSGLLLRRAANLANHDDAWPQHHMRLISHHMRLISHHMRVVQHQMSVV